MGVKAIPMLLLDKHLVMGTGARSCTMLVDLQPQIVPETISVEFQMLPLPSVFGGSCVGSGMTPEACDVVGQFPSTKLREL